MRVLTLRSCHAETRHALHQRIPLQLPAQARHALMEHLHAGTAAETDRLAIETLQEAYGPDYKVVGVRSREVLLNAGNIHCITQQWVKGG